MQRNGFDLLVRGHQPRELGWQVWEDLVVTLFSAASYGQQHKNAGEAALLRLQAARRQCSPMKLSLADCACARIMPCHDGSLTTKNPASVGVTGSASSRGLTCKSSCSCSKALSPLCRGSVGCF